MTKLNAFRALTLAAGLAVALPGLAAARDLAENANNGATSSPFAYTMQVTRAQQPAGIPGPVGGNAQALGNPLRLQLAQTEPHEAAHLPRAVGNSANAWGGFGTGSAQN
ncbi:glycosyl transferase family 39 [Pseudoroseomonas cervicalis]|uniref:glycosyl transferase family 39 n=1 Tax=Teichococcus cervicalis TaxID=204525 RepID=UPI0022F15482|nr:glycosyl transferase family 39 [Pseudoroseomonas cervicalis]WBV43325.1 glycosyl transferase family 39 [Pseudoroseomonas cervicalis]